MFKRWIPKKAAIRVSKTYNNVQMPDNYIVKTEKEILNILEHVRENEDVYCRDTAREDKLSGLPTVDVFSNESGFVPNDPNTPVIGVINYYYQTPQGLKPKKTSFLPALFIFLTAILVFNIIFFIEGAEQNRLHNMCKVYYKHGKATHVVLGDKEFDLENMTEEDFVFLNPWQKEVLKNTKVSECIQIHRR